MDTPAWDIYRSTPGTAKICLYVKTQQDLLKVWKDIEASGLPCALIKDSGLTEFGGVETYTAIGIGPAFSDELRPLTEGLSLF
jgi:PTH2 family peptidyl-tRNA hydrolase